VAWTETALQNYVAPEKFEQNAMIMRFDVSKSVDLRGINLKKRYALLDVFVYGFMYFVYLCLFIE